jgi:carotenoid cleavage dioxygenase-like enzyme
VDTVQEPVNRYLTGAFAPVSQEVTAVDLPVTGTLPAELDGRYLRNGPNPIAPDPATHHWFTGDGMVHGVRLRGGRAEWYRNRWTTAPGAEFAPNTNVVDFGGRTFAIVEAGGTPVELTDELEPIAANGFDGTLEGAYTAHPKVDPSTGLRHAVTYWWPEQSIRYVVVDDGAKVVHNAEIPLDDRPMVHDTAITETRVLLFDVPVTFDLDRATAGERLPYVWRPDRAARVGVLPLLGGPEDVVWCEAPHCFTFHPLNAFDLPDGRLVVDLVKWPKAFDLDDRTGPGVPRTTLVRWTIDPSAGTVAEELLSDQAQEFPRIREDLVGRPHRFGYTVSGILDDLGTGLLKHDLDKGTVESWDPGPLAGSGEAVFVPADGSAAEDDGWLLAFTHDAATDVSSFVVLAAQDIAAGPVATVALPQRVPAGFHGNWIPTPV